MIYNWQQHDWPAFRYDISVVEDMLFVFAELTGHVSGILKSLPEAVQLEAVIDLMVAEAIKTSEIEEEYLSRQDVVSSFRNNLGLNQTPVVTKDKMAQGAGELMSDARKTYADALTAEKLFQWHAMLLREQRNMHVGAWRNHEEPMQIVSGALGKENYILKRLPLPTYRMK